MLQTDDCLVLLGMITVLPFLRAVVSAIHYEHDRQSKEQTNAA